MKKIKKILNINSWMDVVLKICGIITLINAVLFLLNIFIPSKEYILY